MSAPKTLTVYKLLAANETTYGTPVAVTDASNAIQVAERMTIDTEYGSTGDRPPPPGTAGEQIGLAPQGAFYQPTIKIEDKGAGAAYSSSVFSRDSHVLLQACGFDATGSFSGGTEKYTYTPTPAGSAMKSFNYEAYGKAIPGGNVEKWIGNGGYADFEYAVDNTNGVQAFWTFKTMARRDTAPAEAAWTTPTYAHSVVPPVGGPLVFTFNAVTTLIVRSARVVLNRTIQNRFPDYNRTGMHPGFHPARRKPQLIFVCETPAFSTINFHALREAATGVAASMQIGATQYNRRKWTFAQCQVVDVKEQADDQVPLLEVTCRLYNSTPNAVDDVQTVTD
jgi:hypothetical protein